MGSGTTCIAAIIEHRKYIGIERDPYWFDYAQNRIKEASRQLTFDFDIY